MRLPGHAPADGAGAQTGRPAHILHVSTAEELAYLKDFRDIATCEVLVNHLTQVAPDAMTASGLRRDEPADPRPGAPGGGLAGDPRRDGRYDRLRPRAASARQEAAAVAGLSRRADRGADLGADHAGPCERGPAVAGAAGRSDVRGTGAGLWLVGKGRLAAGYDADFTLVDMKRRRRIENSGSSRPAAGRRSPAWRSPAGRSATIVRGKQVMQEDEVLGKPIGRLVRYHG